MASGDESSELSSLSALSSIASDDELGQLSDVEPKKSKKGILNYFSKKSELPPKEPSPPPRKRSPSPPHEYVLADNPDIAVRLARQILPHRSFCFLKCACRGFPASACRHSRSRRQQPLRREISRWMSNAFAYRNHSSL
jgi:hypothetical protein